MRRFMVWIAILAAAYVLLVAVVYLMQDWMIFPGRMMSDGDVERHPPPRVSIFRLQRPGGESFRVALGLPEKPRGVLVFFVGNGENLASCAFRAGRMTRYDMLTIAPEYPGYGESEGSPSMASLLQTAEVTTAHAAQRAEELGVPLVLGGSSIGTFCAVHLAARGIGQRMLLKAPPTSMVEVGRSHYWFLPVALLLKHRFDNLARAARLEIPVLVVHGAEDSIIPIEMGRRLVAAIGENAELLPVPGVAHNDPILDPDGPAAPRIRAFLHGEGR